MSIPASAIVQVTPGVISGGGSALSLNGVLLTTNARVPIGEILTFTSQAAVAAFFGSTSTEASLAATYFLGFDNSNIKPGALSFSQYPIVTVAAWLQGGSVAALTLTELKALSGVLKITVDGTLKTSASITLTAATSFSDAATLILAGFTTPGFTYTYDTVSGGFIFTSSTTGASSTMSFASDTLSAGLKLTATTGATLSQGAIATTTPATFMDALVNKFTNWATFFTAFNPDVSGNANKLLFAAWANAQLDRYVYAAWDTDTAPTTSATATTSLGNILKVNHSNGTVPIFAPDANLAAFIAGAIASIDFTETNGRTNLSFRSQAGITPNVTDLTVYNNLKANGYNCYCDVATANDQFIFLSPGLVTGAFAWLDSYVDQIWLNNALQLALIVLLTEAKSVPYNEAGYGLIRAACMDPINQGLNFGAFRAGVPLSALQAAQVNSAAGLKIDGTLTTQGWYLQILPATAQVRAARGTPPMTFWYMNGQSVQQINLASIEIQ